MADKLQGTWVFKLSLNSFDVYPPTQTKWNVNFTSNGNNYTGIGMGIPPEDTSLTFSITYYGETTKDVVMNGVWGVWGEWTPDEYRTIAISSKYDEVENADTLLQALRIRATQIPSENDVNITMSSAYGTTLKTAGKYCDKDICVRPELESLTVSKNGVYTSDKVGYSSVKVQVDTVEPVVEKDVNFYDYDGTLLYSYTLDDLHLMDRLPSLPSHDGLTCQGWNYDLSTIKSYDRRVDVGANYITADGKSRLYINIADEGRMNVPFRFGQTVDGGVTVDWGDGSPAESFSGTGNKNTYHEYPSAGKYVITLSVVDGCILTFGSKTNNYCVLGQYSTTGTERVYSRMLEKVEIGKGVTSISGYAFSNCDCLRSITIPAEVTGISTAAVTGSYKLEGIVIPNGVKTLSNLSLCGCHKLKHVSLPHSITTIDNDAFRNCTVLEHIAIPKNVTKLGNNTFDSCSSIRSFVVPDTITSLGTYVFQSCRVLGKLVLPSGLTAVPNYMVYKCDTLTRLDIPSSVTRIGSYAFNDCEYMACYDFSKHTAVPTLSSTNAFTDIPADCEIRVPTALYDEWVSATNWSTYASNIVAV